MPYDSKFVNITDFVFKLAAVDVFQSFWSPVHNVARKSYKTFASPMTLLVRTVIFSKFFHLQGYGSSLSYYLK